MNQACTILTEVPLLKIRCQDRNPSSDWEYTVFNYAKVKVKFSLCIPMYSSGEWSPLHPGHFT
jgi:hypothetical protein